MTAPLRHTKAEIRNAAQVARELGLAVRLESDGAITFIPLHTEVGLFDETRFGAERVITLIPATHIDPQMKLVDRHEEIKL